MEKINDLYERVGIYTGSLDLNKIVSYTVTDEDRKNASKIYFDESTFPEVSKIAKISCSTTAIWEDGYKDLRFVCLI